MTNCFNVEEARKIQSILDLFKKFFPFQINGKDLETLIFQGGLGVDTSTVKLATAVGDTGSAGTIATTLTQRRAEIEAFKATENIVGINNLVATLDYEGNPTYESNFELGKAIHADYIFSGAGISREITRRIKGQADFLGKQHYWTIPIISLVSQLQKYFEVNQRTHLHRQVGIICLENGDAGGHNHPEALGFEETLEKFVAADIDKKGEKVIFAGGIRSPTDFVRVLDAGFDAIQLGSLFLLAEETNVFDDYRNLVLNAKKGDVGNVVSPAGLPAKGFVNEGVMRYAMRGVNSLKLACAENSENGCFANCNHIETSAKFAGVRTPGDYCVKLALWQLHTEKEVYKPGRVYFCGTKPEELFIRDYMQQEGVISLPVKTIIGKLLAGVFDSIMNGEGLTDQHRRFLEDKHKSYQNAEQFCGKILKLEQYR